MIFQRRARGGATVEVPDDGSAELFAQIDGLVAANREQRDPDREREIRTLRHRAGAKLVANAGEVPGHPEPSAPPHQNGAGLPSIAPSELDARKLRAGILQNGCLVIKGLIDPDEAVSFAEQMELAFEARDAVGEKGTDEDAYYGRFEPEPPYTLTDRGWVVATGSIWVADSPRLMFDMLDMFERVGLREVITEYLGERPAISVDKCTLRRVDASAGTAWHQDGAFLGDGVRALNVWASLSHCGVDAPGLDVVPKRLNEIAPTGTEGAIFNWSVSDQVATEAAGDTGILRPTFEPGDVVLFDELFLHRTAVDADMPKTRYAIESWFFGPTGFPPDYTPIAF